MNAIQNQSMFEVAVRTVARRTGVDEEIVRSVVHSGMLENIPPHITLRGIYRRYKQARQEKINEQEG